MGSTDSGIRSIYTILIYYMMSCVARGLRSSVEVFGVPLKHPGFRQWIRSSELKLLKH